MTDKKKEPPYILTKDTRDMLIGTVAKECFPPPPKPAPKPEAKPDNRNLLEKLGDEFKSHMRDAWAQLTFEEPKPENPRKTTQQCVNDWVDNVLDKRREYQGDTEQLEALRADMMKLGKERAQWRDERNEAAAKAKAAKQSPSR